MKSDGPTAAGDDRFAPYVTAWKLRLARRRAANEERARQALPEARRAAGILAETFGVERVVLFGSLAWGRFGERSDLDLAVEGLAPERFFRADADLAEALDFAVDLKLLDECPPALRERIARSGMVLYER